MERKILADLQEDKQMLTEAAASLSAIFGNTISEEALDDILRKLDEERLQVVVLGQFKRGKSTLINALFGQAILPTDVIPVTAVITEIRYSTSTNAVIHFLNGESEQVALEELGLYITESENPKNVKGVDKVVIGLPAELLKNGVVIVDTPGVGSAHTHNTRVTYEYLLQADAAVFVFSADPPLTELEQEFLKRILPIVPAILFVLNKSDYLDDEGLRKVLAFNYIVLQELLQQRPDITPVSALKGLQAKQNGNSEKPDESGLATFEGKVSRMLMENRGRYFIIANADRILRLCDEWLNLIALERKARSASLEELNATLLKFNQYMEKIKKSSTRLAFLLEEIKQRLLKYYDEQTQAFIRASAPKLQEQIRIILEENRSVSRNRLFSHIKDSLIDLVIQEFEPYRVRIEKTIKESFNQEIAYLNQEVSQIINDIYRFSAELFQISQVISMSRDAWQYQSRFYYQTWEVEGSLEPFIDAYLMILPRSWFESIVKKKMKRALLRKLDQQWGRFRSDLFYGLSENNRKFLYEFDQILERTAQEISHLVEKQISLKEKDEQALQKNIRIREKQAEEVDRIIRQIQAIRQRWDVPAEEQ